MMMKFKNKPFLKKLRWNHFLIFLMISLLNILAYYFLIESSILDETMLYSWAWIINYLNIKLFFALLIVVSFISFFIARVDFKLKEKPFLVSLFLLAFILSALTWSSPIPNPDIAEFYGVAKYIEVNGLFEYFRDFGTPALKGYRFHSLLPFMGLAFSIFGESTFVIHMIMSSIYAFIPVLTFLLAKALFNRKTAYISSLLVLAMPLMLVQSSMFLVDVPTVFFVLLALITFHRFLHTQKIYYYPLTVVTLLLAITSKRPGILFLMLTLIVLFIHVKRSNGFTLKHLSVKSFIVFYIVFVILFSLVFLKSDFFSDQLALDLSQANISGNPQHYVNPYSYLFQIQPLIMISFFLFLPLFAFKPKVSYLLLIVWIFFPYIFIKGTTVRYMLPAFPAIAMAASLMLAKLKKPTVTFLISIIILSSTLSIVMGYLPYLKNELYDNNIKLSAEYLDDLDVETVGVYMFYDDAEYKTSPKTEIYGYVFDYYSDARVYYDVSESVKKVYTNGFDRFNVFDYYKDENYLQPDYDSVVIFSNVYDYKSLDYEDVLLLSALLDNDYYLNKTFSVGKSAIEENKFAFIYLKNSVVR